jgi:molecular chaperone GrpE
MITQGESQQEEVERLRNELDREHKMHLRALADFDNYRRRVDQERAAVTQRGKRDLLLSLLELVDNFDRALEHLDSSAASEGVQAVHRQLEALLAAQNVVPFESVGETFDPEVHEAAGSEPSDRFKAGTVTHQSRRGYRWGDDLLRPARVRVAQ